MNRWCWFSGLMWVGLLLPATGQGQSENQELAGKQRPNAPAFAQTMGGQQFWTDVLLFRGWRVQQNAVTGHCRLLDDRNRRWASGDFEQCEVKLEKLKRSNGLKPMRGSAVILLHGLADTRAVMSKLAANLEARGIHDHVLNMTYASTRNRVAAHAEALASVIGRLHEIRQIDLVGFSLGSIVIRQYWSRAEGEIASPDPRIGRIVMLGPPNKGADLANRFGKGNRLFEWIGGESAIELGPQWDALAPNLATPTCEFGVIAGAVAQRGIDNPLIEGDDDMIVGVTETLLAGATDFRVLPVTHIELPRHEEVAAHVVKFLQHGYFKSPAARRPIVKRPSP